MIYLACYISSCFFAYIDFRYGKSSKTASFILSAFAVVIPCLVAGMRDPSIGTDVQVYIEPIIKLMKESNDGLMTYLYNEIFVGETNGLFFTALLFFCSRFSNGLFVALFLIELFCIVPVYIVVKKQNFSDGLKSLALFCYYCNFYHLSLNLMKQCVAVSILFLGFELVKKRKTVKYFILLLFTVVFIHKSAVLGLISYIVFILATDKKEFILHQYLKIRVKLEKRSVRRQKTTLFIGTILMFIVMLLNIRKILLVIVVIKHSYIYQLSHLQQFELKYSNFLIMCMLLFPVVLFYSKVLLSDFRYRFHTFMIIISALLFQFVGVSPALYRLSLYTLIFIILAIPDYISLFKKDNRIAVTGYYIFVVTANFAFEVVKNSYAEVYPYILAG